MTESKPVAIPHSGSKPAWLEDDAQVWFRHNGARYQGTAGKIDWREAWRDEVEIYLLEPAKQPAPPSPAEGVGELVEIAGLLDKLLHSKLWRPFDKEAGVLLARHGETILAALAQTADLTAELEVLRKEKADYWPAKSCACGVDAPEDVCDYHRKIAEADLTARLESAREALGEGAKMP